jgi:hypothetical protein
MKEFVRVRISHLKDFSRSSKPIWCDMISTDWIPNTSVISSSNKDQLRRELLSDWKNDFLQNVGVVLIAISFRAIGKRNIYIVTNSIALSAVTDITTLIVKEPWSMFVSTKMSRNRSKIETDEVKCIVLFYPRKRFPEFHPLEE